MTLIDLRSRNNIACHISVHYAIILRNVLGRQLYNILLEYRSVAVRQCGKVRCQTTGGVQEQHFHELLL